METTKQLLQRAKQIIRQKIAMQKIHDAYITNPPLHKGGIRRKGSNLDNSFWSGYDGHSYRIIKGSPCHAAWKAGKYYRRKNTLKDI